MINNRKRKSSWLGMMLALALLVSACAAPPVATESGASSEATTEEVSCEDAIGCVEVAEGDPILLAYMLTISGATASLGDDSRGGIEIAVAERGEIDGHAIEIVGEDSLCSAEGGQTAAQKVASNPSIVGVVGTNCSSAAARPCRSSARLGLC